MESGTMNGSRSFESCLFGSTDSDPAPLSGTSAWHDSATSYETLSAWSVTDNTLADDTSTIVERYLYDAWGRSEAVLGSHLFRGPCPRPAGLTPASSITDRQTTTRWLLTSTRTSFGSSVVTSVLLAATENGDSPPSQVECDRPG